MAEENMSRFFGEPEIEIKKCAVGFVVKGNRYGSNELSAFSSPESLIEWLSRELGAGPIVWALTLEIWREEAGIKLEDLLPVPDPSVDIEGYHKAIHGNAAFLLGYFLERELAKHEVPTPPEPKPKKEKKVKEEKPEGAHPKYRGGGQEEPSPEEERPKEEKGGGNQGKS